MRKVVPAGAPRPPSRCSARLNEGTLTAAPAPPDPTGQISLDGAASSIEPTAAPGVAASPAAQRIADGSRRVAVVCARARVRNVGDRVRRARGRLGRSSGSPCGEWRRVQDSGGAARSFPGEILHARRRRPDRRPGRTSCSPTSAPRCPPSPPAAAGTASKRRTSASR